MIKTPLSTVIGGAFWTPGATILGSSSKNLTQIIKSLFANNEQGFAYDPNDLTTLYQDAAGTVPVTGAGQAVGLILDKSGRGNHARQTTSASRPILQHTPILGNELVVNSTFDTGTSGWEGSNGGQLLAVNGEMRLTNTLAAYGRAGCTIPSIIGKSYKVSCRLRSGGGTSITLGVGNNSGSVALGSVYTASTEYVNTSFIFTAQAETTFIIGLIGTTTVGLTAFFDDISVKEITGYRTDQNYIEYDKIDDKLTTTLPAQLIGCTVIRAVPNVGTQILTNQTIPTPYNDNTNHCGLIVINRALTATETSQITQLFNKAAGV